MKVAITAAFQTLAVLALTALASSPAWAAPRPATAAAAMQDQSACPTPAATNAAPGWKHGNPEYTAYTAVASATDPKQQAQLAQAFIQKYPDSDYKNGALQIELHAQANAQDFQSAFQTAQELLKSPGADAAAMLDADTVISFVGPTIVQPADTAGLATLNSAAVCGEQLAAKQSDANKAAMVTQFMQKAQGFVALNEKNYPAAIATLQKLTSSSPKDAQVYYWLGSAEIQNKDFNDGIFYLARAAYLAPNVAAIKDYLNKIYNDYHGSADGLPDVMTVAQNNSTPPSDFKVVDINTINQQNANAQYQQELAAQHAALLTQDSWAGTVARLEEPSMQDAEWAKLKASKEALALDGIVVDATRTEVEIKVGATDASQATTPDVKVVLDKPLTAATTPKAGETVTVQGIPDAYVLTPNFLLTLKGAGDTPVKIDK